MLRLSILAAAIWPWAALAQGAPSSVRDNAPLTPVWIVAALVIVVALLALLVSGPRRARSHAAAGRRGARRS